jgi:hypothetical protein
MQNNYITRAQPSYVTRLLIGSNVYNQSKIPKLNIRKLFYIEIKIT